MRWGRSTNLRPGDDLCRTRGVPVELVICVIVGPKRRAIQGYADKSASRTRVAQNLRAHIGVRIGCGRTSLRSSGDRFIRSELHLRMQPADSAAAVHDEKDAVRCLPANLQPNAATF